MKHVKQFRRRPVALATGGVVLFALLGTGCVTTAEQGRRMRQDIDGLQVRLGEQREEAQKERAALAGSLAQVAEQVSEMSSRMETLGLSARRNDADFGATVDRMITELQGLRGEIEELRFRLDQGKEDDKSFREETERRFAALKGNEALEAYDTKKATQALERPKEPGPFLAMARAELEAGQAPVARELLEEFLKKWPKDKGAAEAQYLLGESYYEEKAWRPAILELNKFRERHPADPRMPEALLRIAESFAAIDLKPEAGKFFDALIKRYSDTPAARKARVRKKELGIR